MREGPARRDLLVLTLAALLAVATGALAVVESKLETVCRASSRVRALDPDSLDHDARIAAKICASNRLERVATPRVS